MGKFFDRISEYFAYLFDSVRGWLFLLNHEEWMLLLAIVAGCGFLCMRGMGSRQNY
jgi:hypothetical protein